jgi:hypothetical protein
VKHTPASAAYIRMSPCIACSLASLATSDDVYDESNLTHILVRDDLHVLHVSGCFEDLFEDIFRDPGVQTPNIESSLVGLRRSTADGAARRHHVSKLIDRRVLGNRRLVVRRDAQTESWLRRRRHHHTSHAVVKPLLAGSAGRECLIGHYGEIARWGKMSEIV